MLDDRHHRFDLRFSLDEPSRAAKANLLRSAGVPEDEVQAMTRPGLLPGMTLNGATIPDVSRVADRVLFGQGVSSVQLVVSRPAYDEAGHVSIKVVSVGPPTPNGLLTRKVTT